MILMLIDRCIIAVFAAAFMLAQLCFWGWIVTTFEYGWLVIAGVLGAARLLAEGVKS